MLDPINFKLTHLIVANLRKLREEMRFLEELITVFVAFV